MAVTKTDIKSIVLGLLLLGIFIYVRYKLSNQIYDWLLGIFDTIISLFGVGVLLFILNELLGRRIIKRITQ